MTPEPFVAGYRLTDGTELNFRLANAVDYAWTFRQAEVVPESNGLTNVVNIVHWVLEARDGDGITASCYGSVGLAPPDPASFIPFPDLEKSQIETWVITELNKQKRPRDKNPLLPVDVMKENLVKEIAGKKAPQSISKEFNF